MAVMKDVAKLAGVSISTVSFVLNGIAKEHKVADTTIQKVLSAAKQLGYKINSSADDSLAEVRVPTLAFFTPMNSAWIDMSVVDSVINKHMKQIRRNYNILWCPYERGFLTERINQARTSSYDSAIICIEAEEDLEKLEKLDEKCPFVLYNCTSSEYPGVSFLADEAISQAVKIIAAKDYLNLLIISGSDNKNHDDEYLNMLVRFLEDSGVHISEDMFITTENTMIGGTIAARQILNSGKKPEMIICMSSNLAFGAIPLLARNDFLIPRDAELLCFGSSADADHIVNYIPSLSMIAQPIDEITIKAFDMALHLADGKETSMMHYYYPCTLLLNGSFSL